MTFRLVNVKMKQPRDVLPMIPAERTGILVVRRYRGLDPRHALLAAISKLRLSIQVMLRR